MVGYVCTQCRIAANIKRKKRGSGKLELGAWMCFPLGIPYSIWRMCSKYDVCSQCDQDMLVRDDTPIGLRILTLQESGKLLPEKPKPKPLPILNLQELDEAEAPLPPSPPPPPATTPSREDRNSRRPPADTW